MFNKTPAFNLKAVLFETGLAADTLRAWERRYGLPTPNRTAGGHRLYSQYDIETIKWLIARQAEGISISRAVDLWNEQTASGSDPLAASTSSTFSPAQTGLAAYTTDTTLDAIRAEWVAACVAFREANAEQALNKAFSIFPVEAVCTEVMQRGMSEIGTLWYENRASVQQEHFASGLAMRRLDALLSASPAPTRNHTVLIGCPPDEWHTFTPLLLALLLRRRGLKIVYLGANVPTERFSETITAVNANLVILVAQTLISAANLQETALALSNSKIPVGFGGRIFNLRNGLSDHIPGEFLGDSVTASVEQVEKILKGKLKPKETRAASHELISTLQAFLSRRTQIESAVKNMIQPLSIGPEDLSTGIHFLGDNITAALRFGDMDLVTGEMEWLKILLQAHQRTPQELTYFMKAYSKAVDQQINGQGDPIKEWIASESAKLGG